MVLRAILYVGIAAAATIAGFRLDMISCLAVVVKPYTSWLLLLSGIVPLLPIMPIAIETAGDYCPGDNLAYGVISNCNAT